MSFQQRKYTDCDIMEIKEYERLVSSETQVLQSKMTRAIDDAMNSIQAKQSELMAEIKSDPRKSAIRKKNIKLNLQISMEKQIYPDLGHISGPIIAGQRVLAGEAVAALQACVYGQRKKK